MFSLRISLSFICCFLSLTFSYSQRAKWEFGVGLKPLMLQEEPYSLMLKYRLSSIVALRVGAYVTYKESSETVEYRHPYPDTIHRLYYIYQKVEKKFKAGAFLGIQYGKKWSNVYAYAATDFYLKHRRDEVDLPQGISWPEPVSLRPGEVFIALYRPSTKSVGWSLAQSFGVQYFINSDISVALEGGAFYDSFAVSGEIVSAYVRQEENPDGPPELGYGLGFAYGKVPLAERREYKWGFSPLTFLIFNYHF
jgi:hypothetical protein